MTEIKKVQSDINELKASLEHTETVLKEKVAKVGKKVDKLQEQINELWDYQVDSERLEFTDRKIVELEDRSRGNNLRIDGLTEKENETRNECEQEVQSLIAITEGIAKSSKKKQGLYEKFLKNSTPKNEETYNTYKNLFETIKRRSKKKFYSEKFKGDAKKTWSVMKEILGKCTTKSSTLPTKITVNKTDIFDIKNS